MLLIYDTYFSANHSNMQLLGFTFGALYGNPRSWRAMANQSTLVVYVSQSGAKVTYARDFPRLAVFTCFPAYYGGPAVTFFPRLVATICVFRRLAVVTCFPPFYCGPAVTFFPRLVATTCVFPRLVGLHFFQRLNANRSFQSRDWCRHGSYVFPCAWRGYC